MIETGVGNCHLYVDATADQDMALDILINAKTQRPSVCNAVETLLVHADVAEEFLPRALQALDRRRRDRARGRARRRVRRSGAGRARPTSPRSTCRSTWRPRWSTTWTRPWPTSAATPPGTARRSSPSRSGRPQRFVAEVDAAAVLVNASSRFVDGGEFGFGAEIGISTQKLHARGPMGLPEMTSTKYVRDRCRTDPLTMADPLGMPRMRLGLDTAGGGSRGAERASHSGVGVRRHRLRDPA